jgi:CRISPR/Cas system-associated exonuclease Cas4 (RecB family)
LRGFIVIEEIRELFQNLIAPQLEGIRGDIRAADMKVESFRRELLVEIRRVEEVLSTDFVRLEQKVDLRLANVDTRLAAINEKMDLQRRELLAEIRAAK